MWSLLWYITMLFLATIVISAINLVNRYYFTFTNCDFGFLWYLAFIVILPSIAFFATIVQPGHYCIFGNRCGLDYSKDNIFLAIDMVQIYNIDIIFKN